MTVTRWSQNLASGSSLALQSLGNGRPGRFGPSMPCQAARYLWRCFVSERVVFLFAWISMYKEKDQDDKRNDSNLLQRR